MAFSACTNAESSTSTIPTLELVVITPTPTFTPILPTVTPTATPLMDLTAQFLGMTPESTEERLVNQSREALSAQYGFPVESIQLLKVDIALWEESPDCTDIEVESIDVGILGYRIWFLVNDMVYEFHADEADTQLCETVLAIESEPEILILVDPIAQESVIIAQNRVAQELDISSRRVSLVDLELQEWTDSSLGCPAVGQVYTPATTYGYRIILEAGGNTYVFHATFDRVIRCQNEAE